MLVYKCWPEGDACGRCPVSFDKAGNWDLTCWHPSNSLSDYLRQCWAQVYSGSI
jgi:hypothetical protein